MKRLDRVMSVVLVAGLVGACAARSKQGATDAAAPASAAGGDAGAMEEAGGALAEEEEDGDADFAREGEALDTADPGAADLEAELASLERNLAALGVAVPGVRVEDQTREKNEVVAPVQTETETRKAKSKRAGRAAATPARDDGGRCERICNLARATCELESRICDMARRHDGESRYAAACTRAGRDCSLAEEACHACAG